MKNKCVNGLHTLLAKLKGTAQDLRVVQRALHPHLSKPENYVSVH